MREGDPVENLTNAEQYVARALVLFIVIIMLTAWTLL